MKNKTNFIKEHCNKQITQDCINTFKHISNSYKTKIPHLSSNKQTKNKAKKTKNKKSKNQKTNPNVNTQIIRSINTIQQKAYLNYLKT